MQLDANALKNGPLWEHLVDTVAVLLQERPEAPLELFERLSHFVSDGKLVPLPKKGAKKDGDETHVAEESVNWAKNFINQVVPPKKEKKVNEDGEEEPEEEPEEEDKGMLPDILQEQETFRWCGVGLPETEAFRVMVALKRLLDGKPLASVRFWGKIFGLKKDYYICETEIDAERMPEGGDEGEAAEEEEEGGPKPTAIYDQLNTYKIKPPPVIKPEAKGSGTNKFVYFVATSDDLTQWTELPDLQPAWVLAARKINKFFTGDLEAPVTAHPPFPGVEKHYLRAQISRIMHTTVVAPRLIFSLTEAPEEEEEDEDGPKKPKLYTVNAWEEIPEIQPTEAPDPEDEEAAKFKVWTQGYKDDALMKLDNWVHLQPPLLQSQGRASLFKPEEEEAEGDGEEEEGEKPPPPPPEQINPRLSDLGHDSKLRFKCHSKSAHPVWAVKKAFHVSSSSTRVYAVSSLLWPGSHTYARCEDNKIGAQYANMYMGYGQKRDKAAQTFAPQMPTPPMQEYAMASEGILQVDATPDDEFEFAKPVVAPPPQEEAEEENEEEED